MGFLRHERTEKDDQGEEYPIIRLRTLIAVFARGQPESFGIWSSYLLCKQSVTLKVGSHPLKPTAFFSWIARARGNTEC